MTTELDHHHDWHPTNDTTYTCTHCTETTTPCNTCTQPLNTDLRTCDKCLHAARRIITDITTALTDNPFHRAETTGLRANRYDRPKISTSTDNSRLPFGLDRITEDPEDARIEAAKHPNTALEVLRDWATSWADQRDEDTPGDYWADYLTSHTQWASQNPADSGWHEYLTEAKRVRATIRRLLGLTAEREPTPCVHCGGPVIRECLDDGMDDTRRCQQCAHTWPDADRLATANRHTILGLRVTNPDMLVTIEEAKAILPEARRGTLDTWARRAQLNPTNARFPVRGHNARGKATYRLGDIEDAWRDRHLKRVPA